MASSNPSNFANLPKDELKEIAAKGGHASHGSGKDDVSCLKYLHARAQ
jgi:general stress protein YciG